MNLRYELIDIGTLPNGTWSEAKGINDHGHVVGWSDTDDRFFDGFIWDGVTMTALGTNRENDGSRATAVNDLDQVIGATHPPFREVYNGRPYMPFVYENGAISYLPLVDNAWLQLHDINNHSEVVGVWETWESRTPGKIVGGRLRSVVIRDGVMVDLFATGWPLDSELHATAINDRGEIAGGAYADDFRHAALWQNGSVRDLGTLGRWSMAADVNNRGHVVGSSETHAEDEVAFLWDGSEMVALGTLPGRSQSMAYGLNDGGQIVGQSCRWQEVLDFHDPHAILWQNGEIHDLNNVVRDLDGLEILSAVDINNHGQIACVGHREGIRRALLLNPL